MDALDRSRTVACDRFLFSLGIPLVGEHVARLLVEAFGDIHAVSLKSEQELQQVHGIGPEVAQSVVAFFHEPHNRDMIDRLLAAGVNPIPLKVPAPPPGSAFAGKTLVFTGAPVMPRGEAKKLVEDTGGKVSGSVSRKTDFVVVGEDPGSKLDRPRELGVQVLTEAEFCAKAGIA